MSTRHRGAYSENNADKIRFVETCGHNKLCPYKVLRLLLLLEYKIGFTSNETANEPARFNQSVRTSYALWRNTAKGLSTGKFP